MRGSLTLGFDTSAAHCAAALVSGGRVLAQCCEPMTRGQAERLFPLLQDLLSSQGLGWSDLTAIGVGVGPGNFTGIRISVAAARGLALSLGIPAVGITTTEAAALDLPRPCRVVVPLRGDEVLWQDFGHAPEGPVPAPLGAPPAQGDAAALGETLTATGQGRRGGAGAQALTGTHAAPAPGPRPDFPAQSAPAPRGSTPNGGAQAGPAQGLRDALPPGPPVAEPLWPQAAAIALLAERRAAAGSALPRPAPVYLRPADAAPPRDAAPALLP
ncbi:tRNA (adenosine(37)-N6)-threonylcarbamoyltransferase complex dimerization subunit type 1 TsaB [Paracoccus endophyticus]|uniref:tRNA (adenosine(37)-N6)-threonylcarbamoyltransferase complex dimerization subunit type 1 TsaB n=1 Tax=Paracoccus endophyticus TaxID=2233774 RepID=UPI000DDB639C|nr:tRNA (adenosine(37)-N6)-threonylcarbamoyltransferase complex dimerization subunit type 1 TsaB [Paracoccus endophyticus]